MPDELELSIGIVTFRRPEILDQCLGRILAQARDRPIEIIVCDQAVDDEATQAVLARRGSEPGATIRQARSAVPKNITSGWEACTRAARARVILFFCDDSFAMEGLLDRHIRFHREHAGERFALQGRIVESEAARPTPFMRWTQSSGIRFGSPAESSESVPPWLFRLFNSSVAVEDLLEIGFDLDFGFGGDDIDIGMRLGASGVTFAYDADARAEHFHPTNLETTMGKLHTYGVAGRKLKERYPDYPQPRRPAFRHRAWAQLLTALNFAGVQARPVKEETWRFLCTQALREGLWNETPREGLELRVGTRLARRAAADPAASWPA